MLLQFFEAVQLLSKEQDVLSMLHFPQTIGGAGTGAGTGCGEGAGAGNGKGAGAGSGKGAGTGVISSHNPYFS
jgi:hypothetical protein